MKDCNIEALKRRIDIDEEIKEASAKISFLDKIVEEMESGCLSIFAGAGLSAASGYVDWKTLLVPMSKSLGLNVNMDLTLLAQYYKNKYSRSELNRAILNEFAKIPLQNDNMEILSRLPIRKYWTTNYDSIIEDVLRKSGKIVDVIIDQVQFKDHTMDRDVVVYKMHGDRTFPDSTILCKEDYELYDESRVLFTQGLTLELVTNTVLFIGFSFSDPNLDRIMALVRKLNKDSTPKTHYCFMRSVRLEDYFQDGKISDESIQQYEQDRNMQRLKLEDMKNYGIQPIVVESFDQITLMLKYIERKYSLNSVFISGALNPETPNDYGTYQKKEDTEEIGRAERFIMELSRRLIDENYKIYTGFGIGIGNYVVAGAYMMNQNRRISKIEEKIHIQPMVSINKRNTSDIKDKIRRNLIDQCGIFVSIFGKSDVNDLEEEMQEKDGTYKEYQIASEADKIIIPVGATGFTSRKIYDLEKGKWEKAGKVYKGLGDEDSDAEELVKHVMLAITEKKVLQEEKMKQSLIHTFNSSHSKKIFLSFHYESAAKIAKKVRMILNETNSYTVDEEEKKNEASDIKKWIDEKIEGTRATIILFNKKISDSKWIKYEFQKSIENDNCFLFLILQKDKKDFEKYFKSQQDKLRKVKIETLYYEKENEFKNIPDILDKLLSE